MESSWCEMICEFDGFCTFSFGARVSRGLRCRDTTCAWHCVTGLSQNVLPPVNSCAEKSLNSLPIHLHPMYPLPLWLSIQHIQLTGIILRP